MRILLPLLLILAAAPLAHAQTVWYVDDDGDTENGCTSWTDACPELQTALSLANAGHQVWVAVGTYKPDYDADTGQHTADHESRFRLYSGVAIYGGFAGWEKSLEERAGLFDDTILSGDLLGNDLPGFVNYEDNSYRVMLAYAGVDATGRLDGFTISSGHATDYMKGAGMWNKNSSPTLANCTFTLNLTSENASGAGMYNENSSPTLTNCNFIQNATTFASGAGMFIEESSPVLDRCIFDGNTAGTNSYGGGVVAASGSPVFVQCVFTNNFAFLRGGGVYVLNSYPVFDNCVFEDNMSNFNGGGAYFNGFVEGHGEFSDCVFRGNSSNMGGGLWTSGSATLTNCRFIANSAQEGAGMLNYGPVTVVDCTFMNNSALGVFGFGGGVLSTNAFPTPVWQNCVFEGNTAKKGAGMQIFGRGRILNSTFMSNFAEELGGGLAVGDSEKFVEVFNSIAWGNSDSAGQGEESQIAGDSVMINHSCVQGWTGAMGGVGNHGEDPLFVDPVGPDGEPGTEDDDLRLLPDSPCIDAADSSAVLANVTTDLDGNPRFINDPFTEDAGLGDCPVVDMGAYELQKGLAECCLPDFDNDGAIGPFDLAVLLGNWGPNPGHPADLDHDDRVGSADLAILLGSWGPCE